MSSADNSQATLVCSVGYPHPTAFSSFYSYIKCFFYSSSSSSCPSESTMLPEMRSKRDVARDLTHRGFRLASFLPPGLSRGCPPNEKV